MQRSLTALLASSCLLTGLPAASLAQANPGFVLFGPQGVREHALNYRLDFDGQPGGIDRYRLRIRRSDLANAQLQDLAVAQIQISYPNTYSGDFDPRRIELRVGGKSVPLESASWQPDNNLIEVIPQDPIPSGRDMEVVLSNVRNPRSGGIFYFNCRVITPGGSPLFRHVGTWVISTQ
ncbi:DUF2808 domain-containing protein [Leptolyngbya sp. FACHB-261]|nr:DUF2808 domain-containing protein [Leptolyngbya sp. FACHB-261]